MKAVVIGGVAGGATAAVRLRRLDGQAESAVFKSGHISYANCGLPSPASTWNRASPCGQRRVPSASRNPSAPAARKPQCRRPGASSAWS